MTKSQFARCFRDFPWLWGIKQAWHHEEDLIEIRVADYGTFDQDTALNPGNIWVYGSGVPNNPDERWIKSDLYVLKKAEISTTNQFGSIALNAATTWFGQGLEYVAISRQIGNRALHMQIFRAPRDTTLWKFLERYNHDTQKVTEEKREARHVYK